MLSTRHRDSLGPLALITVIVGGALLLYSCVAHAAGLAVDPTPALTSASDAGWATLTADGPWWLGIAVLHVALRAFLGRQHWLQQGRLLAGLTALAGVSAAVVAWHWQGAPSAGILTALIAGGTLLLHPAPVSPTSSSTARSGLVAMLVLLTGCSTTQARQTGAAGVVAALDCEAAHLDAQALADAKLFAEAKVQAWIAGGKAPSSDAIRADLAPIKSDLGRCAITAALAAATVLLQSTPGEAVSALVAGPDPAQVRERFGAAARWAGWPPVLVSHGKTPSDDVVL